MVIQVIKIFFCTILSCVPNHLFLISSASVRFVPFSVLYCAHLCLKCSLGISDFLEDISSLSHSIVFLCFFALFTEKGWGTGAQCHHLNLWRNKFNSYLKLWDLPKYLGLLSFSLVKSVFIIFLIRFDKEVFLLLALKKKKTQKQLCVNTDLLYCNFSELADAFL